MSLHKVGDLVECTWQPGASHYDSKRGVMMRMKYVIKDEMGIIIEVEDGTDSTMRYTILFPRYSYSHTLVAKAFINYSAKERERERDIMRANKISYIL